MNLKLDAILNNQEKKGAKKDAVCSVSPELRVSISWPVQNFLFRPYALCIETYLHVTSRARHVTAMNSTRPQMAAIYSFRLLSCEVSMWHSYVLEQVDFYGALSLLWYRSDNFARR